MDYQVRQAKPEDLGRIEEIYAYARDFMARHGNPTQWGTTHPPFEKLVQDIAEGDLFVVTDGETIHGVFYFRIGEDPTYRIIDGGTWRTEKPYGTIHWIAGDGCGGILKTAVTFASGQIDHLRIDTHADNYVMQAALAKQGFEFRGVIRLLDGSPRIAYDLLL